MKQQTSCATETHNKSSKTIDYTGKTIHVGIDVHLKDWQIASVNETVVLGNHRPRLFVSEHTVYDPNASKGIIRNTEKTIFYDYPSDEAKIRFWYSVGYFNIVPNVFYQAIKKLQLYVDQDECAALYFYLRRLEIELRRKY